MSVIFLQAKHNILVLSVYEIILESAKTTSIIISTKYEHCFDNRVNYECIDIINDEMNILKWLSNVVSLQYRRYVK